jgi:hypothetical protein
LYGNPYEYFTAAFSQKFPVVGKISNVDIIKPSSAEDAEGFFDILSSIDDIVKKAAPAFSSILTTGSPFLGPIAGPITAATGVAIGVVGNLCESTMDGSIPSAKKNLSFDGCAERAVLAEAALQTVLGIDKEDSISEQILKDMETTYRSLAPNMKKLAPKLLPVLMDPALRIAMDDLSKPKPNISVGGAESFIPGPPRPLKNAQITESTSESVDPEAEAFMVGLLGPTKVVAGEEGFFDTLGSLIKTGMKYGKPLLREGVKLGFKKLEGVLADKDSGSAEAGWDGDANPNIDALYKLSQRAVMGEAALQALMKVPRKQLESLSIVRDDGGIGAREEGFFDSMKTVMQGIGRQVVATAPSVIKAVTPVILNLLQGQGDQAAAKPTALPVVIQGRQQLGGGLQPPAAQKLRPRRSIGNFLKEKAATNGNGSLQVSALAATASSFDYIAAAASEQHPVISFYGDRGEDEAPAPAPPVSPSAIARPSLKRKDSNEDGVVFAPP